MEKATGKKAKGKRTGSEKRERGKVKTLRMTAAEGEKAEADAAALGLSFGSYVRWLLFEKPQTRPTRRALPPDSLLRQLKAEAGRVDGNLAQFLKLANRGEAVPLDAITDAANAVRDFYLHALETLRSV